jgi:hypothetical protein
MLNNRKNDHKAEREVAAFLDKHLYSNTNIFDEYARTDGFEEQMSGSDILLSISSKKLDKVVVDEKVAVRYANTNLDTFSIELSFINKIGKKTIGWFLDDSKSTQYYLLGWITKADIPFDEEKNKWSVYEINRDNIKELEWVLVSRQKIIKFLEDKGWTLDKLGRQDAKIRENGGVATKDFIDDVSFRYSPAYVEKPVNILLKKKTYMELAIVKGTIYN